MPVYTVHEPPLQPAQSSTDAERFVFVRDGLSFWAFLFAPLWMLWHRMWLMLLGYVVITTVVVSALAVLGASQTALLVIGLLISLLVGLEASTLRRFTLGRRGWKNVGIVSGDDLDDAERRFFTAWLGQVPAQHEAASPPPAAPRAAPTPSVIGLFPEPGARR